MEHLLNFKKFYFNLENSYQKFVFNARDDEEADAGDAKIIKLSQTINKGSQR